MVLMVVLVLHVGEGSGLVPTPCIGGKKSLSLSFSLFSFSIFSLILSIYFKSIINL